MRLLEPLAIGPRRAANRVIFGPIVTNLGNDHRQFSERHVAFYAARARGGCGVIVTEGASVHDSDWPYERAPLAERCAAGWAAIVDACRPHGAVVIASLDHAGGQGSSAYHQRELWAPSRVPEVNSREVPKWMDDEDIAAVIDGFAAAARTAIDAGCDGVEINAGQHSLVRQFLSGLTNQRDDQWGQERTRFAAAVLAGVRRVSPIVGLRLSCDELAPWAGITPEQAPGLAATLVGDPTEQLVDYVVVTRGSIFSAEKTRADFHEPAGHNLAVARAVKAAIPATVVIVQGSIVDPALAEAACTDDDGPALDGVEMTRAQLADPQLVAKLGDGAPGTVRPCTRCNQTCQVRDARNPLITCVGEPSTGHETTDPVWLASTPAARRVLVVGGGPAGLETARVAALNGHDVTVVERSERSGGIAASAGPHQALVAWLGDACGAAGARIMTSTDVAEIDVDRFEVIVQCTGGQRGDATYQLEPGAVIIDVADLHRGLATLPVSGSVAVLDPIGGPIGVALAESLGERAVLITPDHIAGNELSRTGDLAPANVRLAQRGVRIERRSVVRRVGPSGVVVADRFSGVERHLDVAAVVDCSYRLPTEAIAGAQLAAGDCVAPRTIHEAILEGRRAALAIDTTMPRRSPTMS